MRTPPAVEYAAPFLGDPDTQLSSVTEIDQDTIAEGSPGRRRRRQKEMWRGLARGAELGRYLILDKLGEGGMGIVYSAYDPELLRRVAIKLLLPVGRSPSSAAAGRARLVREAQAMARLSHPNVIHVYDVGTYDDHVFLALELVEGDTVKRWARSERRPWHDVLRVFVAAGRGLAAAHAAGLVHRDFKPDNVLVGNDGRVLVTDFGLARAETGDVEPVIEESSSQRRRLGSQEHRTMDEPLTGTGVVIGTPGYAAPEHAIRGQLADARSDQFSFAASLYTSLYRRRPFVVDSFAAYADALAAGPPEPPPDTDVPIWVRRVVERGLSLEPEARFASMDDLLDALARDPAVRRRRWIAGTSLGILVAIAGGATSYALSETADSELVACRDEHELDGVWDAAGVRREEVLTAFLATKRPTARAMFETTANRLDERARAWTAMHADTCTARVHGEQSETVLALRMQCLDDRRRELGQLVDLLATADATVVDRAVYATTTLSPLDECANVSHAAIELPTDPLTRAQITGARTTLARAKAQSDAGKFKDAIATAKRALVAARASGYRPLEADVLLSLGTFEGFIGDHDTATTTLRSAVRVADATRDDRTRLKALVRLVGVIGADQKRANEGLALADDARATLDRIAGDARSEALLEINTGRVHVVLGDFERALEHTRKALVLQRRLYGEDHLGTGMVHNNLGSVLNSLGRRRESLNEYRIARATWEKLVGRDHPGSALIRGNIANQLLQLGEHDEALREADAVLAVHQRELVPHHAFTSYILDVRAVALAELGRVDEARVVFDALIETLQREPRHAGPALVGALANRAIHVHAARGHGREALADADEAVALAHALPTVREVLPTALIARGRALELLGRLAPALAEYRQAMQIIEVTHGRGNPTLIEVLIAIGRLELAARNRTGAVTVLERALEICETENVEGKWLVRTRRALALARR